MNIANVTQGERGFRIIRDDQSPTEFPFVWLSDSDPNELHPTTRERVFNLTCIRSSQYQSINAHKARQTTAMPASRMPVSFNPTSGERHLRGHNIERNEIDTRIRVITREEI